MTSWLLVVGVIVSTVMADLLQSGAMKRHGAITDFRLLSLSRAWGRAFHQTTLILSILYMASSFFFFLKLLETNDLSFSVPATAGSIVIETAAARFILREVVPPTRWAGVTLVALGVFLLAS